MPELNSREIVNKCIREFDEDSKHHDLWIQKVDMWYRAWRGVLDTRSDAAKWKSKLHPPYLLQIVETMVAGLQDPKPAWKVKARPKMDSPEEIARLRDGARALELLLGYQRQVDGLALKQRPHRLQGLIAGLTVWKTYWRLEERMISRTQEVIENDEMGMAQIVERDIASIGIDRDDPACELVDVRDWIWHESARSVESANRIHHRVWMSFDELKELEQQGYYKNVDELKESKNFTDGLASRETDLFNVDRTKDLIMVVEHWVDGGKRVVTVANKKVLLRDRPNPFQHGGFPFIAASGIPDLFRIPGVSMVELVEELQSMLWTLQNQRMDNLELINNGIVMVRDDVLDPAGFVFAPGEQWLVSDKDAVTMWTPNGDVARYSLEAEALIKADIQNIPGASPALMGQPSATNQTATEVSLLTNLAQRRLSSQKLNFTLSDVAVGDQWIELNRQFMTEPRMVAIVGKDGDEGWELIHPDQFAEGNFSIIVDQQDESLIRQERLAETQSRLQIAISAVPVMAAIGQPLNMKAFVEDVLDAGGIDDKERYFSATPQPQAPGAGAPQQAPGQPAQPELTAPQAYDQNSPSHTFSQSPAAAMQRMTSSNGGPSNV